MKKNKFVRRHPLFKEHLYIVCEGIADEIFLDKFFKQFELKYEVKVIGSGSINNIFNTYKKIKAVHNDITVIIFIDLDGKGDKNLKKIKDDFKNNGFKSIKDIYFVNPVIEFLFVLAKEDKHSMYTKKEDYKKDIKRLYGIDEYKGARKECEKIVSLISLKEWEDFKTKIMNCNKEFNQLPSTNLYKLLDRLKIKKESSN